MVLKYRIYISLLFILSCLLILYPGIDIQISNYFFVENSFYKTNIFIRIINKFIEILGLVEGVILTIICGIFWFKDRKKIFISEKNISSKELSNKFFTLRTLLIFINHVLEKIIHKITQIDKNAKERFLLISVSSFCGPLAFVHLTKWFFGRARPYQIEYFGGTELFSSAFTISNACLHSCSFISGHAAIGFLFYTFYFAYKDDKPSIGRFFFWLATILGSFFGFIRIVCGAHFISDVLMAGLFVYGISIILYEVWLYKSNTFLKLHTI